LVIAATLVSGKSRRRSSGKLFFDGGSTCSMVRPVLVRSLNLPTENRTLVVKTFHRTEVVDSEMVVLELLDTDGRVKFLRTYVVDEIITMPKVNIPDSVKTGFSQSAQARWPETRVVGQIDVLIGKDAEAYQPDIIGRVDNMGLYSSIFSETHIATLVCT
jgi:hypothetical protein